MKSIDMYKYTCENYNMTPKPKAFKDIDCIREKDEAIFLSAITSLFESGHANYTKETKLKLIQNIVAEVKYDQIHSMPINIITPEYRIAIVETAYELSKYDIWNLLEYIKRYVIISGNKNGNKRLSDFD